MRDETRDWRLGLLSAGLFAATYRLAEAWLDPLFLVLWLLFIYLVREQKSLWRAALAGAFVARVKIGGYDSVLMPAYAAISVYRIGFE